MFNMPMKQPKSRFHDWTITGKLWLSFGLLVFFMAINAFAVFLLLGRISSNVRQLVEVEQPLERAIMEMEINAGETAHAVLDYIRVHEAHNRIKANDSESDFKKYASEFIRLAETDEERRLGRQIISMYLEFNDLGDQIMAMADRQLSGFKTFRKDTRKIGEMIDTIILTTINLSDRDGVRKLESALRMEIDIDVAFAAIESYMLDSDQQAQREEILRTENSFRYHLAEYRSTLLSAEEKKWLNLIEIDFADTVKAGQMVIAATDDLHMVLERFNDDIERIDFLLDNRIQPLIHAETVRANLDARRSSITAITVTILMGILAISITGFVTWVTHRSIISSVKRLAEGARNIAEGNLRFRIEVKTKDELGLLAIKFNEMAEERMKAEEEITRQAKKLEISNRELEQFAYVASHDLQEPLRKVVSFTQLLKDRYQGKIDEKADRWIGFIVDGAFRMQNLIQDLLLYSRVETQGKEFELTDFTEVCRKAVANLDAALSELGGSVVTVDLPTLPADSSQMVRLFQNLLGNAIKYRGDQQPIIEVGAKPENGSWVFAVRDNGIGIDPKNSKRIFDMFQRLHSRDEYSGTGIGLAVCKKIVERHGGTIRVISQVGMGSTFEFTIPKNGYQ